MAVSGLIELLNFKDPSVVQYTIFDKRSDPDPINFGENYGGFIFGIWDMENNVSAPLDPAYGALKLQSI